MQPHDHGGKGHLAFHAVLPDGIYDSSWEVDVEVTQEDNAVRVLQPTAPVGEKNRLTFSKSFLRGRKTEICESKAHYCIRN